MNKMIVTHEWMGKDKRKYRSVKYHVGGGQYTAGYLQVEDDLANWVNYTEPKK